MPRGDFFMENGIIIQAGACNNKTA